MSLALHGHQLLVITTLAFATAVLTPNWYTSPDKSLKFNVFQLCMVSESQFESCRWTFSSAINSTTLGRINLVFPILTASFSIACVLTSLVALLLGSWYIQRAAHENECKWLLILTVSITALSFLFSCAVWIIMMTTNLHQKAFEISEIRVKDFGFSFWTGVGSSSLYLGVLSLYLIAICTY